MHLRDLYEMPITGWNHSPDMDANEKTMVSKFTGYSQERLHYTDKDKEAIKEPKHIHDVFKKIPYNFNIYFYQLDDPDYDPYLQVGRKSIKWLKEHNIDFEKYYQADAINIVITSNISDTYKIGFNSPWIFAHRIGHALAGRTPQYFGYQFLKFIQKIVEIGYGTEWPDPDASYFDYQLSNEYTYVYTAIFGKHLGTMASARNDKLVNGFEWFYETFAQYIVRGKIVINPLPKQISDDEILTDDPVKLRKLEKMVNQFPKNVEKHFNKIMKDSVGDIFVM